MAIVGCPLFGSRYLRSAMNVQFHARPRFMNHPSWSHITTTIRVITSDTTTFRVTPSQVLDIGHPYQKCNMFSFYPCSCRWHYCGTKFYTLYTLWVVDAKNRSIVFYSGGGITVVPISSIPKSMGLNGN